MRTVENPQGWNQRQLSGVRHHNRPSLPAGAGFGTQNEGLAAYAAGALSYLYDTGAGAMDWRSLLDASSVGGAGVSRVNVAGAATITRSATIVAIEATLTADLTSLTIDGWSTATDIYQAVRVSLVQDATGIRTVDLSTIAVQWETATPTVLPTSANQDFFHFDAWTIDGGTTVHAEAITR